MESERDPVFADPEIARAPFGRERTVRLCAIVNPRSGSWQRSHSVHADPVALTAQWLSPSAPEDVSVKVMRGAKDGTRLTREALTEGCDTIVAVGGDGTINDVIQGICEADDGQRARLGLIPMGTANVLAHILGVPLHDPSEAGRLVREGVERRIDLGYAGAQWFALVAGIGFDGAVTRAIDPRWKRRLGRLAYVAMAARLAIDYPRTRLSISVDYGAPQEHDAYLVLIANGGCYAGSFSLGDEVRLDDGLLDLFVCLRRGALIPTLAATSYALLRGRLDRMPGVIHQRVRHVAVTSNGPLPVQFDGDAVSVTPIAIELFPGALKVIAPLPEAEGRAAH